MNGSDTQNMYSAVDEVIRPKRSLEVLSYLSEHGKSNYTTIEDAVPTSSDIVTDRLGTLQEYGLIKREERSSRNVQYSLTENGMTFLTELKEIDEFLQGTYTD